MIGFRDAMASLLDISDSTTLDNLFMVFDRNGRRFIGAETWLKGMSTLCLGTNAEKSALCWQVRHHKAGLDNGQLLHPCTAGCSGALRRCIGSSRVRPEPFGLTRLGSCSTWLRALVSPARMLWRSLQSNGLLTCTCERFFSCVKNTKGKTRSCLSDDNLRNILRIAVSRTLVPDFNKIVNAKQNKKKQLMLIAY